MNNYLLGLGLILCVSFLDIGQSSSYTWAYDLPAAQKALKAQNFETVIELLSPEVEKLNRESLFVLAKAYTSLKKHEAAIKAYTACLALNPQDHEAKTLIGVEQLEAGKYIDALPTLKDAIEMNPKYLPAYKALAVYYEKRKNKYELRVLHEDIVEKFGERSENIAQLCELSVQDRLYDIGAKYCLRGIQMAPSVAENYVYLGISFKETGKSQKAEEYFKKAADDFPQSELAQLTYAQHLDEQKNFISSYNYYKRAATAHPTSISSQLGLGQASLEIQKYAEALETFRKVCQIDKKKVLPSFRKATNTLRVMKMAEWLKKFETGIEKCGG